MKFPLGDVSEVMPVVSGKARYFARVFRVLCSSWFQSFFKLRLSGMPHFRIELAGLLLSNARLSLNSPNCCR
jgi:hypothetical protein